jgi:hypothetical protein
MHWRRLQNHLQDLLMLGDRANHPMPLNAFSDLLRTVTLSSPPTVDHGTERED